MTSKIYTRTGDAGTTGLFGGERVSKADPRVEAYGTVDEANAFVGAARALVEDADLGDMLDFVMHKLFNCSSALAHPPCETPKTNIVAEDIEKLEAATDRFMAAAGPIGGFVLPTGTRTASSLHLARTVCRRAERRIVALFDQAPSDPMVLKFINRASDFLFAAARYANKIDGLGDIFWNSNLK